MFMICSMSKTKPPAIDPAIATDPELVRLERDIRILHEVAEIGMATAEAMSKDPTRVLRTPDSFLRLADEVRRTIAQAHKLQEQYRRRREKLERERARRLATARALFLAAGSPPAGTRH